MDQYPIHVQNNMQSSAAAAGANGASSQHDETAIHDDYVNPSAAATSTASQNNQTAIDEHGNLSAAAANGASYVEEETDIQEYFESSDPAFNDTPFLEDNQAAIEKFSLSAAIAANGTSDGQNDETAIQEYFNSSAAGSWSHDLDKFANIEEYLNSFPVGYRFAPTDEELIMSYLKNKIENKPLPPNNIPEVNLYSKHPAQLAAEHKSHEETEWYFFTPRDKKYPNGSRPNRGTESGYWKPTGTDKFIRGPDKQLVGYRKTLDFMEGQHPGGGKTQWKMHEYIVNKDRDGNNKDDDNSRSNSRPKDDLTLDDWVLCRIYKKKERNGGSEASTSGTHPANINLPYDFMVGNGTGFEGQPIGNVPQSNEASFMGFMDGDTGIAFNSNQGPMHGEQGNFMVGNGNGFGGQPILIVSQSDQAFPMDGNAGIAFNPNQGPRHGEPGNFMVGNGNGLEGHQQTLNVSHNDEGFSMAGSTSLAFEGQGLSNPNQAPNHEEPGNFMVGNSYEFVGNPTVNLPQNNETLAGNAGIELQDQGISSSNQGPKHEEPAGNSMFGNMRNEFQGQSSIFNASQSNEAFMVGGNTSIAFEGQLVLPNPSNGPIYEGIMSDFRAPFLANTTTNLFGNEEGKDWLDDIYFPASHSP